MAIPFDSLAVQCVVEELQAWVGAKIEAFIEVSPTSIAIRLYGGPVLKSSHLLMDWGIGLGRIHLADKPNKSTDSRFNHLIEPLRSRVGGGHVEAIRQLKGDRLVECILMGPGGQTHMILELTGRNSNMILTEGNYQILACAKAVHPSQSKRPLGPRLPYRLPPVITDSDELKLSPFCRAKMEESSSFRAAVEARNWHPILYPGQGCYPVEVPGMEGEALHCRTFHEAADRFFTQCELDRKFRDLQSSLAGRLKRRMESISHSIRQMEAVVEAGGKARRLQEVGNGLLASPNLQRAEQDVVEIQLADESWESVKMDSSLSTVQNANRYFERAKRALARLPVVKSQLEILRQEREKSVEWLQRIDGATGEEELLRISQELPKRVQSVQVPPGEAKKKFDGHRIREYTGPGGESILVGENALANHWLVTRVGQSNDWWLHVRGGTSAHVLIQTGNKPDRVSRQTLLYAGELAAKHSPSKHSGLVSIDYTLKKYVRRQRGAPPGQVIYTHEKTLSIELNK